MSKPELLLHICCAPCSTHAIFLLRKQFTLTGYFYNPNIHPVEEYHRRLHAMQQFAQRIGLPLIQGDYDPQGWFEKTSGMESLPEGGKRCEICLLIRMQKSAKQAKKSGFDYFSTVLTTSPHKNATVINEIGERMGNKYSILFQKCDLKKKNGFKKSINLSKIFNIYRQQYCGCLYSKKTA